MAWYDEYYVMTDDFTKNFQFQVYGTAFAAKYYQIGGPIVAVLMMVVAVTLMVTARKRERETARGSYTALSLALDLTEEA